jgi:hypothetical protein
MTEQKIDLYKVHKSEYVTPKAPVLIQTRPAQYLAIIGKGAPGGDQFSACIGALYSMAFTIKMTRKFAGQQDYAVCKLESLWPCEINIAPAPKEQWEWKLLIRTPDFISEVDRRQALDTLRKKGKSPNAEKVKLETIDEGQCVQMLHIGPYDREHETVALMRAFAEQKGLQIFGQHHEVYLSDPRRVQPERLKTILRNPVKKV